MYQITFQVAYVANCGECIRMVGQVMPTGRKVCEVLCYDGEVWRGELSFVAQEEVLLYHYELVRGHEVLRREGGEEHVARMETVGKMQVMDRWCVEGIDRLLAHGAMAKVLGEGRSERREKREGGESRLVLHAMPAPRGWAWGVLGSSGHLGNWDVRRVLRLVHWGRYEWSVPLWAKEDLNGGTEYKYVLVKVDEPCVVKWEEGENRRLPLRFGRMMVNDYDAMVEMPKWRAAGVVVPVFALRSEGSWGIGDFGDVKRMVDWAVKVRMKVVQVLPVNDTTREGEWGDSYPYSAVSVFALHPIYVDAREWAMRKCFERYEREGARLNEGRELDYVGVWRLKMNFWLDLYEEIGEGLCDTLMFGEWVGDNGDWLEDYVNFCSERDVALGMKREGMSERGKGKDEYIERLRGMGRMERLMFYRFQQFVLHRQLSGGHEYARSRGVMLKGDIPIGVSPDSVEVKAHGELFHVGQSAGAPPDAFAREGQNWGFPTYNWGRMAEDGYAWWRRRTRNMAEYFDAFRIDHVLGFFRIWSIPRNQRSGVLGHFYPALPYGQRDLRNFGFAPKAERFVQPHLDAKAYGEWTEKWGDLSRFFERVGQMYVLKPHFCAQRNIEREVREVELRRALDELAEEVLFVREEGLEGAYHPRIEGYKTRVFEELAEEDQRAYRRLHDVFFYERHTAFWRKEALEKLPAVATEGAEMLPCAEDLGMVPDCVPQVMEEMGILTLHIQTMPKVYGRMFDSTWDYPYASVATIATHDMPPFRLWWRRCRDGARAFWHEVMGNREECPEVLSAEGSKWVAKLHAECPSMLCLLSFQDWTAICEGSRAEDEVDEQINHPENPKQRWKYRMHMTIERLMEEYELNEEIKRMIVESKRDVYGEE